MNRFAPKIRYMPRIIECLGYCPYKPIESFPDWLRRCRTVVGLSQEKLAGLLRVDESTVAGLGARKAQADGSTGPYYGCRSVSGKGVIRPGGRKGTDKIVFFTAELTAATSG